MTEELFEWLQKAVQAGEFDNYSSGTSNGAHQPRPEMVQRVAEVAVAVATKGRKGEEAMVKVIYSFILIPLKSCKHFVIL